MEEFAQTREADNLFADDFTPIETPIITHPVKSHPPTAQQPRRSGHAKKFSPAPVTSLSSPPATTTTIVENPTLPSSTNTDSPSTVRTPAAVRGDRSATGGINKPKLSESELSSRLAAAKLNNARREEAHRAAEADEASFQRREAEAIQKRREEGAARRVMEGEREKNRLRKLGSRGGREWDEGKQQQDISAARGGSQYRRGVYGGTTASRGSGRVQEEGNHYRGHEGSGERGYSHQGVGGRGRGGDRARGDRDRGGRRGGGGRGPGGHAGGRGGGENKNPSTSSSHPAINRAPDSPLLRPPSKAPAKSMSKFKSSNSPQKVPSPAPPPTQSSNQQKTTMPPRANGNSLQSTNSKSLQSTNSNSLQPTNSNSLQPTSTTSTTTTWKPDVEPFSPLTGESGSGGSRGGGFSSLTTEKLN